VKLKGGTLDDFKVFEDAMKAHEFFSVLPSQPLPPGVPPEDPENNILPTGMYSWNHPWVPPAAELSLFDAETRVKAAGNQAAAKIGKPWGYWLIGLDVMSWCLELKNVQPEEKNRIDGPVVPDHPELAAADDRPASDFVYAGKSGDCPNPNVADSGWELAISNSHPNRRIKTRVKVTYGKPGSWSHFYRDDTVNPQDKVPVGCSDHPIAGTFTSLTLIRADWADPPVQRK
jgi:hypothetical protein